MEKSNKNHAKKLCRLYYQDTIWRLSDEGKSVREITKLINSNFIPRSKFKGTTLSQTTIYTITKKERK